MSASIVSFDILDGISPEALRKLDACRKRSFSPRQIVHAAGDDTPSVLLVLSGRLKLSRTLASGRTVTVCNLGPGDVLGLPSCVLRNRMPVTATALSPVEARTWPSEMLLRLLEKDPVLARNALSVLSGYIQLIAANAEGHVGEVRGRIARALLLLASENARWRGSDQWEITVTRLEIAELTGSTIATVSRVLSAWRQAGFVGGARGRISILSPDQIVAFAEPSDDSPVRETSTQMRKPRRGGGSRDPVGRELTRSGA